MITRDTLVSLLENTWAEIDQFTQSTGTAEREEIGTLQRWAARDMLAHLAYWNGIMAERIAVLRAGGIPQRVADFNAANDAIFEHFQRTPWADVLDLLEKAHTDLLTQIEKLSESEINDPAAYAWLEGRPLWRRIIDTGYVHPMIHLFTAYLQRGDATAAQRLAQTEFDQLQPLDASDQWQATLIYNQACHQALAGDKASALVSLEKALTLAPSFADWALEDTDLANLRQEPAFLELIRRVQPPA